MSIFAHQSAAFAATTSLPRTNNLNLPRLDDLVRRIYKDILAENLVQRNSCPFSECGVELDYSSSGTSNVLYTHLVGDRHRSTPTPLARQENGP